MSYQPVPIPSHIPEKLTITLWDFSWYTRTGPGEPFEDLDAAFLQSAERGYNTIRICAMPFLLFGTSHGGESASFGPLGGQYAQNVRWYDVKHRVTMNARDHLISLFEAAKRHGFFVIVSSWEYQQSSAFYGDASWFDELMAVDLSNRPAVLARCIADMVDFLASRDLADRIAFVELHNEVQFGFLANALPDGEVQPGFATGGLSNGMDPVLDLKERLTAGLDLFHDRHPGIAVTVNYAGVPAGVMRGIPENIDVAVFHPYVYGVLDEFTARFKLRDESRFSTAVVRPLLRSGAPDYVDWQPPAEDAWRKRATIVGKPEIYVHDWCDVEAVDRYLYERFQNHHYAMLTKLDLWIDVAADFAASRGIPLVFAEGWVGYTPLHSWYEEGPIGAEFCRIAARKSNEIDAWGYIVCSNAAPHHPMWGEAALQRQCNTIFTQGLEA
ncbi:hypothetical protein ET495_16710 [Xylanimonas allomyrinae]|uniref:Sugar-binding cellulase-like protein n=1 Tax=Xylanimonas allomyrinae TaxID=2509459 RepID=A0A4P6F2I4_9MICO|nr:cellulase-like family protein [Xylanimonas allomyrinae]QAY64568.1 hypothetical protein ET495_16710 [Xylanimonas allomyrinae]